MTALLKKTIGEIVADNHHAAQLFELLGIDYASHGRLTLREACASAGLETLKVKRSLEQLPEAPAQNWFDRTLTELVVYVRDEQNAALQRSAAHVAALVATPHCRVCDSWSADVDRVRTHCAALCEVLYPHVAREEHVLLPVVVHFDECWARAEVPSMRLTGGISMAVAAFVGDHEQLTRHVNELQQIALLLSTREPRCSELLRALHDLNHRVREHVHLENNILYPRAAALECVIDGAGQRSRLHRPVHA